MIECEGVGARAPVPAAPRNTGYSCAGVGTLEQDVAEIRVGAANIPAVYSSGLRLLRSRRIFFFRCSPWFYLQPNSRGDDGDNVSMPKLCQFLVYFALWRFCSRACLLVLLQ